MKENLAALAAKVGELQWRASCVSTRSSERLAKKPLPGIKRDEFHFDEKPGQGGPAMVMDHDLTLPEFQQMLDEMSRVLDDRSDKLGVLDCCS